jgi:hypothetical protein
MKLELGWLKILPRPTNLWVTDRLQMAAAHGSTVEPLMLPWGDSPVERQRIRQVEIIVAWPNPFVRIMATSIRQ